MDEERYALLAKAEMQYRSYNKGSVLWSVAHHWSMAAAILSSAASAFLLEQSIFDIPHNVHIAAGLAVIAGLLSALAVSGGFERKWRANRISRGRVAVIELELTNPNVDLDRARLTLERVITKHDEGVLGSSEDD